MRTFLAGFSMFIGIVAVIVSVLMGTVGKAYLESAGEQLNGREVSYAAQISEGNFSSSEAIGRLAGASRRVHPDSGIAFSPKEDVFLSLANDHVDFTENSLADKDMLSSAGVLDALFVTAGYNKVFNLPMTSGRWFSGESIDRLEVVVNKSAAQNMKDVKFVYASTHSSLNLVPMPVVGVVNDGWDSGRIYVNVLGFSRFAGHLWESDHATLYVHDRGDIGRAAVESSVTDLLHDTSSGKLSGLSAMTSASAYADVAVVLQVGFFVCAVLLLFVSAVGLINIGLATLEQRTRELLVRRSLGATRSSVALLVLGGSMLLALCISLVAIAMSFGIVELLAHLLPHDAPVSPPRFPLSAAAIATGSAVVTAAIGGAIPAIRAARLQPALALR